MNVDKKPGGVATVQTLSRLNRIYPALKKDWTMDRRQAGQRDENGGNKGGGLFHVT